jgi:hypothetical protein
MGKEEFLLVCGVMQGWFSAKLGSKISDGSQLSAQFSVGTNSHADSTNRINLFYSSIWIQLVFSQTWVQNQ